MQEIEFYKLYTFLYKDLNVLNKMAFPDNQAIFIKKKKFSFKKIDKIDFFFLKKTLPWFNNYQILYRNMLSSVWVLLKMVQIDFNISGFISLGEGGSFIKACSIT